MAVLGAFLRHPLTSFWRRPRLGPLCTEALTHSIKLRFRPLV